MPSAVKARAAAAMRSAGSAALASTDRRVCRPVKVVGALTSRRSTSNQCRRPSGSWAKRATVRSGRGLPCGAGGGPGSKAASARLRKAGFRNLGVLSSEETCLLVFFGGRPSSRNSGKFHGFGSFQSGVHSVLVAGVTTGRVEAAAWAAGAGIGGQALASAGRRRHRQAEGWCSPTSAGVRRRPEPSLRHGCAIRSSYYKRGPDG